MKIFRALIRLHSIYLYYNLKMENLEKECSALTSENTLYEETQQKIATNSFKNFMLNGKSSSFPNEKSNQLQAFTYFMLLSLCALSNTMTQHIINQQAQSSSFMSFGQEFYLQYFLYRSTFIGLILLKVLLFLSASMEIILKQEVLVVSWVNRKCANNFGILKQLDLSLSGFMVLVSWRENIAQLILSGAISLFYAIYLQEYVDRKDLLYSSSSNQYILFRLYLLLSYFANIAFLALNNQFYSVFYSALMFVLLLSWYQIYGHLLYISSFSRTAFKIVIALFLTCYVAFIQNWIQDVPLISFNQISRLMLVFSLMLSFFYLRKKVFLKEIISALPTNNQQKGAKIMDIYLLRLLEQSIQDKDSEALLIGTLHQSKTIESIAPISIEQTIYDPSLKEHVALKDIYFQKETALKFLIKEQYVKSLQNAEEGGKFLDYCQFILNQFHSISQALEIIEKAKKLSLSVVERVKTTKMESLLKQHHEKLNMQIFDGKLEIEHIIESEQTFHHIQQKINHYILGSLDVWSSLQLQEIEMGELRNALKREMKTIEEMNGLWKGISKFFKVNKAWRFIYVHYIMFIQNEKIKQKELDLFVSDAEEQSIFNSQAIYFEESTAESKLFDPEVMFNQNSCCLFAAIQEGQLLIKDVNSRFTKTLGYSKEEIQGSPISVIMPPDIVAQHNAKCKEWVNSGYLSNEASYHPKFTAFVTKENKQIPAVKYYKAHYSIERGLEFACLLKSNEKLQILKNEQIEQERLESKDQQGNSIHVVSQLIGQQFQQNKQTDISLIKNIFLKDDFLQPNPTTTDIKYFKFVARLLILLITTAILILAGITNFNSDNLNTYSSQFITFMSIYRLPFFLGTNYMKKFLKIGNTTRTNTMIVSVTNQFLQNTNQMITEKTIFDLKLNPSNTYYPGLNYSLHNKDKLSQTDLFYSMVSSISSLNTPTINRTGQQYQFFISYLKPAYDTMMNTTKNELHKTFGEIFSTAISQQIWFSIGQAVGIVIFIIILFKLVQSFITKMRNIYLILLDFQPVHILKTYRYWKEVRKNFKIIFIQHKEQSKCTGKTIKQSNSHSKEQQSRTNQKPRSISNQTKKTNEDAFRKNLQYKLKVLLVLILISILALAVITQFSLLTALTDMYQFEKDGFFFLRYFPCGPIVAMGCIEKYYSDQYPQQIKFNQSKYDDVLASMFIFGSNNNYIGEITDPSSLYYIKEKNYFFGSPCQFNPQLTINAGVSVAKCLSIANGTFKQGISSYLRYGQRLGESCIRNKTFLTPAQLDQFTVASTVLSAYVLDAIVTWTSEFSQKVTELQAQNFNNCIIILSVVLIIHFLVMEHRLIGLIEKQYEFMKQIYLHYVPQFVLIKEKVIRQKFVIEGIISN